MTAREKCREAMRLENEATMINKSAIHGPAFEIKN